MPTHYEEEMNAIQGVDPVSGNEVPVGAKPEEVRDDIDAKLSENEFVVPADVVRYFGVAHFENLIKKAKKGWMDLEEEGRIGGEEAPPEPSPPEDDLPFSDEELLSDDVPEASEEPVEMADGGLVQPSFDPKEFTTGFSTFAGGGVENKTYINAQGEKRSIMFISGVPMQKIPEGFLLDTPQNRLSLERTVEEAVKEEVKAADDLHAEVGGREEEADYQTAKTADYANMTDEQIAQETRIGQTMAGFVGGAFAGPLGARAMRGLASREQRKDMEEQGIDNATIDKALGTTRGRTKGLLGADSVLGRTLDRIQHDRKAAAAQAEFEADPRDYDDPGRKRERDRDRETFGTDPEGDPDPYSPDIDTTGFNKGGLVSKKDWKKKRKGRKKIKLATRK